MEATKATPQRQDGKSYWKAFGQILIMNPDKQRRQGIRFATFHAITTAGIVDEATIRLAVIKDVIATHRACQRPGFVPVYESKTPGGQAFRANMVEIWSIDEITEQKFRNQTTAKRRKPIATVSLEQLELPGIIAGIVPEHPENCMHGVDLNAPCSQCNAGVANMETVPEFCDHGTHRGKFCGLCNLPAQVPPQCIHGRYAGEICYACDLDGGITPPVVVKSAEDIMAEALLNAPPLLRNPDPVTTDAPEAKAPAFQSSLQGDPAPERLRDCEQCQIGGWIIDRTGGQFAVECPQCNKKTKTFGARAIAVHAWNEGETTPA